MSNPTPDSDELPMLGPDEVPEDAIIIDGGPILQDGEPVAILDAKKAIEEADVSFDRETADKLTPTSE